MNDTEKLKALATYVETLRASIERLEIKADFFESILPELDPEFERRYQYYLHDRTKELQKDGDSSHWLLFSDRE